MLQKLLIPIFMVVVFLVTSTIHFQASQSHVDADQPVDINVRATTIDANSSVQKQEKGESPLGNKDLKEKRMVDRSSQSIENNRTQVETLTRAHDEAKIIIDGYEYILIMDDEKFPNLRKLIILAGKYGAKLYGIEYSDVFAMTKEGETIAHITSGHYSVLPAYAEMIKEIFLDEYIGIQEKIDLVLETSAPVTVKVDEYTIYKIYIKDGWLMIGTS
ncbi:hypothetical protein [Bacillus sp. B15-48]|uniref:hypothetical protein n=1 Tax=Bacillus sp. B15-48 TaxID=1548601 RepID=UPI001940029F|nr:hypothetical protein [Bacillus sp. B15-48]MBM4761851.1 hypothetical protein [Bacillus sp. B15-48]